MTHWPACWEPNQDSLILADAAGQSDRVLLAVHQPPTIRRMQVPLPGQRHAAEASARDADQDELLESLLGPASHEGTLVIPILGRPGSGKSHLVKWLRASIPSSDSRFVVRHVPKEGTTLPQVVDILLKGLDGPRFDEIRESLATAKTGIGSLEEAREKLALSMATLIRFGLPSGWSRAVHVGAQMRDSLTEALPALLTDPATREHLTREDGPIARLARDLVEGYQRADDDEEEEKLGFAVEDLAFTPTSLRGAGRPARMAVNALALPEVSDAATKMLSDAIDAAAPDVIGLGSISLNDVMFDIRSELHENGKELVLLFEDMAIIRGLQLDLIDAITTPAIRDGRQQLATLRAVLAITDTYWDEQVPEMLATRIGSWGGDMFSLDAPTADHLDAIPDFIGRYLNAARIGIATAASTSEPGEGEEIPNRCDACPFDVRPRCHSMFGSSSTGHGLFPLTRDAAVTLGKLASPRTLRPREILRAVVGPVIREGVGLEDGNFPSPSGDLERTVAAGLQSQQLPQLPLADLTAIDDANLTDTDRARARTLLSSWGPGARMPAFLEHFSLGTLRLGEGSARPVRTTTRRPETRESAPDLHDPRLQNIDDWAGGNVALAAELARDLRKALLDEIKAGVRWEEMALSREGALRYLGISRGASQQEPNRAIRIENAGGAFAATAVEPLLVVQPNAGNATLLRGIHQRQQTGSWAFPGGYVALARLRSTLRSVERAIHERLVSGPFAPSETLGAAQLLILAGSCLGLVAWEEQGLNGPLAGALRESIVEFDQPERTTAWANLTRQARSDHQKALEFLCAALGRHQGVRADVTAVDLTMLDLKKIEADPGATRRGPSGSSQWETPHATLLAAAEAALATEAEAVKAIVARIERHIGVGESLKLDRIFEECKPPIEVARRAAVLAPSDAYEGLREMQRRLPSAKEAAALLSAARSASSSADRRLSLEALGRVSLLKVEPLARIADCLDLLDEVLTESIAAATGRTARTSNAGSEFVQARQVIEAVVAHVDTIVDAVTGEST